MDPMESLPWLKVIKDGRSADDKDAPTGWHVADTSPSGINRLLPDDYQPVSLPHNRHPSGMYVTKIWAVVGLSLAALGVFYAFYLVLR